MQVNILQAKNQLSQLIKYAQAGDEVVIANRGVPVVQLIRLMPGKAGLAHKAVNPNFLHWLEANALPRHAQRTAQKIDAGIAEERSSWDECMGLIYLDACLLIYAIEDHPVWANDVRTALQQKSNARFAASSLIKI